MCLISEKILKCDPACVQVSSALQPKKKCIAVELSELEEELSVDQEQCCVQGEQCCVTDAADRITPHVT